MNDKYRGLKTNGNGWVYGNLITGYIHHKSGYSITEHGTVWYEIIPESAGRYICTKNSHDIYDGDIIKFWYFYNSSMNSADCFCTEPQNSFTVYEEYLEQTEGTVFIKEGTPFIRYKKRNDIIESPLYVILNSLGNEVSNFYMCGYGGSVDHFMSTFEPEELEGIEPVHLKEGDDIIDEDYYKFFEYVGKIVDRIAENIEVIGNIHKSKNNE